MRTLPIVEKIVPVSIRELTDLETKAGAEKLSLLKASRISKASKRSLSINTNVDLKSLDQYYKDYPVEMKVASKEVDQDENCVDCK